MGNIDVLINPDMHPGNINLTFTSFSEYIMVVRETLLWSYPVINFLISYAGWSRLVIGMEFTDLKIPNL